MASLLHEDPRYFRRGPAVRRWYRVGYALSRVVVTRTDSGHSRFNYSGVIGMAMGIALSNAYYPDSSVNAREVGERFGTSLLASALYQSFAGILARYSSRNFSITSRAIRVLRRLPDSGSWPRLD